MNTHALYTEWMNAGCGRRGDWACVCARRSALCGGSWRAECAKPFGSALDAGVGRGHAEDSALLAVGDVDPLTHTPVVKIYLHAFLSFRDIYFDEAQSVRGLLDEDSILAVRVALGRRALEASSSKVDTLRLVSDIDDRRMRRHAARIVALADARVIRFLSPFAASDADARNAWSLDLPPAARELEVITRSHLAPTIAGPGAAALRKLRLDYAVLSECPRLPSLVSLDLNSVTVEAPFAPGAWCPLLDELDLFCCEIRQARVDIRLPRLRFLDMDSVDVAPHRRDTEAPYGVITIDAPELIQFEIDCAAGGTTDYKSFTLRAPRLRLLGWRNQYSERMVIDVGRPGSVKFGGITLKSIYSRGVMYYRE
ncbi:unnamed protein product [Miscanthus lutarioriparius]|uniref:Uncharacterized protein n=1 Tax=Miscanthus lutarioriparius TaxID=422564 RepID=A0A811SI14_9POAL|nr:unnamed protein product [Miscanthus lutarioriparius]